MDYLQSMERVADDARCSIPVMARLRSTTRIQPDVGAYPTSASGVLRPSSRSRAVVSRSRRDRRRGQDAEVGTEAVVEAAPLDGQGRAAAVAAAVFLLALAVYGRTLAPTVTLVDSGELIVAASHLSVAHPPGFPLYCVLAHLATRVPVGSVAERVNEASALFAALAAAALVLVARVALTASPRAASVAERVPPWADLVPPALAGLLLAFSRSSGRTRPSPRSTPSTPCWLCSSGSPSCRGAGIPSGEAF